MGKRIEFVGFIGMDNLAVFSEYIGKYTSSPDGFKSGQDYTLALFKDDGKDLDFLMEYEGDRHELGRSVAAALYKHLDIDPVKLGKNATEEMKKHFDIKVLLDRLNSDEEIPVINIMVR